MPLANVTSRSLGWLLVVLLVITFSLGALLTQTLNERNEVKQALKDAKQELKQEKAETDLQKGNFNGCLGSLAEINKGIADNAEKTRRASELAQELASSSMSQLPSLIKQDRSLAAQPEAATTWLKGLFQ